MVLLFMKIELYPEIYQENIEVTKTLLLAVTSQSNFQLST